MKWNFPIIRKAIEMYKELGFFKFLAWFIVIWLGFKLLVFNLIAVVFFDGASFPIINYFIDLLTHK